MKPKSDTNAVARAYDIESGDVLAEFAGHSNILTSVSLVSHELILTSSADATCRSAFRPSSRVFEKTIFSGSAFDRLNVRSGRNHDSDEWGFSCRLWDIRNGQQVRLFKGHSGPVNAASACEAKNLLISGGGDK
jgi:WD40 repeat protein